MKNYIKLFRVKHYVKNLLVFAPIFFSLNFFSAEMLGQGIYAFVQFCLLSSCIYIINDLHDVDKDRMHPTKCKRPLASGAIRENKAKVLVIVLFGSVVLLQIIFGLKVIAAWLILLTYFVENILYSVFGFKNMALIDVYMLALGFVLRVMYGSACTGIEISAWLYLVIFFGSLFMGLGKRKNELKRCGGETRDVLAKYNIDFLGKCFHSAMTLAIVFYSIWCLEKDTENNKKYLISIPVFTFILLKYALDIEADEDGDPTTVILGDKSLILVCIALISLLGGIMYLG